MSNLMEVTVAIYPQHLDCHLLATVFTLPYIREAAAADRGARRIVAQSDPQ